MHTKHEIESYTITSEKVMLFEEGDPKEHLIAIPIEMMAEIFKGMISIEMDAKEKQAVMNNVLPYPVKVA